MITLLTPSKTMNFVSTVPDYVNPTPPHFTYESQAIRTELATYDTRTIMRTMGVSQAIATSVAMMYSTTTSRPALWAYAGDVFKGFRASTITQPGADFAQDHLLIASAVYGVLRPYDMISPYRLEMRARLVIDSTTTVYEFWQGAIGEYVQGLLGASGELCVLSSEEYAKPIVSYLDVSTRIITPMFLDLKANGVVAQIPIYNKMMRGVMARWIVDGRIDSIDALSAFSAHGYKYRSDMGTSGRPAFFRARMEPLKFT